MIAILSGIYNEIKESYTQAQSRELLLNSQLVAKLFDYTVVVGFTGKTVSMGLVVASVAIAALFAPFVSTAGFLGLAFRVWFFGNLARVSENLIRLGCNPAQVIDSDPTSQSELVEQLIKNSNNIKTALKTNTLYFDLGIEFFVDSALFITKFQGNNTNPATK